MRKLIDIDFCSLICSQNYGLFYKKERMVYVPRTGENIYKRKDGRWEGRYKYGFDKNGKTKYRSVYSKTYTGCKEKLLFKKISMKSERKCTRVNMTVKELFENWLKNITIKVKITTYEAYKRIIENHILPFMAKMPVYQVTAVFLNDFIARKAKTGRINGKGGLSVKTILNIISVIKSAFKYAEKIYNMNNPANFITLPKANRNKIEVLSDEEIKKINDYCNIHRDYFSLVYELSLSTGIRIGELCALQCGDIDFENGILKIRKTVQRVKSTDTSCKNKTVVVIDTPKTINSKREIPLSKSLIEKLKVFTAEKKDMDFLFSPDNRKSFDVRTIQKKFASVLEKCNIRKVKFHILRHTFATKWANSNFDVKALSEILGHSSVNITLSLYIHSSMENKRKNINQLFLL